MLTENVSLQPYNTFGFAATARYFADIQDVNSLKSLFGEASVWALPHLVLGGGSNVLLLQEKLNALVLKVNLRGRRLLDDDGENVLIEAAAGENWHELVLYTLEAGLFGLENLSLIPGLVGASPMQNIGAYGVEIRDVFQQLQAFDLHTGQFRTFTAADCRFGYRESVFKHEARGRYFITSVTFRLSRRPHLRLDYGDIRGVLSGWGIENPSPHDVSRAVMHIRRSKLPNPAQIGNAGSFFKNPEIEDALYQELIRQFPQAPGYATGPGRVKVPAGWLIEQAGWKGRRLGPVGVHERQALVLVHYGGGQGSQVAELAAAIQADVRKKFGVALQPEVNFIS